MDFWTKISLGLGIGLIAGFVGTAAITIAQMIEMKITGRTPSNAPAEAAGKVLGFQPKSNKDAIRLAQYVHWEYGTKWGLGRAFLAFFGIFGWMATALHFLAVWITALVMLPSLGLVPSIDKWSSKQIGIDALLHIIYAVAAGVTYDWLTAQALPHIY